MQIPVTGYANRLSVRPGETIRFHISTTAAKFDGRIVKMHRELAGFEPAPSPVDGEYAGHHHPIRTGSHGKLATSDATWPDDLLITCDLSPTLLDQNEAGIITFGEDCGLFVNDSILELRMAGGKTRSAFVLELGHWYHVTALFDPVAGQIRLTVASPGQATSVSDAPTSIETAVAASRLRIAAVADGNGERAHFDGKIARVAISSSSQGGLSRWDFGQDFASFSLPDLTGNGHTLKLEQTPRRAVTGPDWDGRFHDPRFAPSHYDAIAFHSDDLTDAGWPSSLSLTIPEEWRSGIYALEITANGQRDHLPFFVRRATSSKAADVAFLVPTFSYLAYANERHWWMMPDVEERTGKGVRDAVTKAEVWAEREQLLSCYDRHRDLTGCTHSSYLRPIVNMRAEYWHPYIGGPHQLSADLHILDWLTTHFGEVDIVIDHDLHAEGASAIEGNKAVITGSHPEYVSEAVLDALTEFNRQGGHLAYLGGNGFYCVVATYPTAPHVMELRRGHANEMHWKSPSGEAHHAATGEMGGEWRLRGRSAHYLFGLGTAQVLFERGGAYLRTEDSRRPEVSWIFDGVDGGTIDTESIIMGQPCGFEIDRMSAQYGTPAHAIRLASAWFEPDNTPMQLVETQWTGITPENRADLVYIPGGHSGDVFAAGSIAWTGCLWTNGGNNKVSRIMHNIISRFAK